MTRPPILDDEFHGLRPLDSDGISLPVVAMLIGVGFVLSLVAAYAIWHGLSAMAGVV